MKIVRAMSSKVPSFKAPTQIALFRFCALYCHYPSRRLIRTMRYKRIGALAPPTHAPYTAKLRTNGSALDLEIVNRTSATSTPANR